MAGLNPDPFTQTMRALRKGLLEDFQVVATMRPKNFPDLTGTDVDPIKDNVQDADLPELLITPSATLNVQIPYTNTDHRITEQWALRLATGETVVDEKLFPLKWALLCAFARMQLASGANLGLPFIERIHITNTKDMFNTDSEGQRGTKGWVALLGLEIAFKFTDNDLSLVRARA